MGRDWAKRPFLRRFSGIFVFALAALSVSAPAHASFESDCSAAGGSAKSLASGKTICRCGAWDRTINPRDSVEAGECKARSLTPVVNMVANFNSEFTCSDCPQDGYANNQNDSCDETLIGNQLADDQSGYWFTFGLIHSSASECHQINDTSSPADLEKYLATGSKYRFGAGIGVVNGCFSNANDGEKKQAIAKYYYLNNRLRAADLASIESIASIDSMLGQNFSDSFGKNFGERCRDPMMKDRTDACDFFASQCGAQGGMAPLVQQTKLALQTKDKLEKEISDLKAQDAAQAELANYGGQMKDYSSKIQSDEKSIADLEAANPWMKGKAFNSTASNYSGPARYQDSAVQAMVQNQFVQDRDSLLKRLDSYKQATQCLNSEAANRAGLCKNFDKIINDTPNLLLGSQDRSTTREQALAQYYMGQAQCRWDINNDAKSVSGDMKELIGNTLLTLGTAGLSSWAAGAKLAAEGVNAAKGMSQVALGADLALNAGFAASGGIQAYKGCMKDLNQVGALARPSAGSSSQLSCPVNPYSTANAIPNITANVRSCVTQTIAAAAGILPIAPTVLLSKPFLALREMRGAASDVTKGASAAKELGAGEASAREISAPEAKAPEATARSATAEPAATRVEKEFPLSSPQSAEEPYQEAAQASSFTAETINPTRMPGAQLSRDPNDIQQIYRNLRKANDDLKTAVKSNADPAEFLTDLKYQIPPGEGLMRVVSPEEAAQIMKDGSMGKGYDFGFNSEDVRLGHGNNFIILRCKDCKDIHFESSEMGSGMINTSGIPASKLEFIVLKPGLKPSPDIAASEAALSSAGQRHIEAIQKQIATAKKRLGQLDIPFGKPGTRQYAEEMNRYVSRQKALQEKIAELKAEQHRVTENDRSLTAGLKKLRRNWRNQVDAAKTFKDPTLLPAFGKSDEERVQDAEAGLKALGLLHEDLTPEQRELIRDHLGAAQDKPYFSLTHDEIVAKVRNARREGFTAQQTDFLIRSGYAGSAGPAAALRTIDDQPVGGTLARELANPEYYISVPGPDGERIPGRYLGRNVGDGVPVAEFKEGNQIVVRKLTDAEHQGWMRDPSAQRGFSSLESSIPADKRYAMITDRNGRTYPVEFLSVVKDARDGGASARALVKDPESGELTLRDISRGDFSQARYTNAEEFRGFRGSRQEVATAKPASAASPPADFKGSPYEYQEMTDAQGRQYVVRALRTVKDYSGRNVIEAQVKDPISGQTSYRKLYSEEMSQFTKKPISSQDFEQFEGTRARAEREAQSRANQDASLLGINGAAPQDEASADQSLQALSQRVDPRGGSPLNASQRSAALRMVDHYSQSIEKLQVRAPSAAGRTESALSRIQKSVVDQMTAPELSQERSELLAAHPEFANQPSRSMRPDVAIQYRRYEQINTKLEEQAKFAKQETRRAQLVEMRKAEEREMRTGPNAPEIARLLTDAQKSSLQATIAIMGKRAATISPEDIAQIKSMRALLEQKQSWNLQSDLLQARGIAEEDRALASRFDEAYAKLKQNYGSDSFYLAERQRRVIEPPKVNTYDKIGVAELKISTHGVRISRNDEQKISTALKAATETFSFESLHGVARYYPVITSSRDFRQVENVLSENGIKLDSGILENVNALTTVDAMDVDHVPRLFQAGRRFIQELGQVPGGLDAVRNLNNHYLNQIIDTVDFQVTRYVPQGVRDLPPAGQ